MLRDITIQNHRCLQDFRLSRLNRFNLIVGRNNSGKTSLLEAIYLLLNKGNPRSFFDIYDNRNEWIKKLDKDGYIYTAYPIFNIFSDNSSNSDHVIYIDSYQDLSRSLEIKYFDAAININYFSHSEKVKDSITVYEDETIRKPDAQKLKTIPSATCCWVSHQKKSFEELASLWDQVSLTEGEKMIIKCLRIIQANVENVGFSAGKISDLIKLKLSNHSDPVPMSSMGEGINRLLSLALSAVTAKEGSLLVDEIDQGLDYESQVKLWQILIQISNYFDIQVFATALSWDCIFAFNNALKLSKSEEGKLFRLQKGSEGITVKDYLPDEYIQQARHLS